MAELIALGIVTIQSMIRIQVKWKIRSQALSSVVLQLNMSAVQRLDVGGSIVI